MVARQHDVCVIKAHGSRLKKTRLLHCSRCVGSCNSCFSHVDGQLSAFFCCSLFIPVHATGQNPYSQGAGREAAVAAAQKSAKGKGKEGKGKNTWADNELDSEVDSKILSVTVQVYLELWSLQKAMLSRAC